MNVIETAIPEVKVFEPRVFGDERGFFGRSWCKKEMEENRNVP